MYRKVCISLVEAKVNLLVEIKYNLNWLRSCGPAWKIQVYEIHISFPSNKLQKITTLHNFSVGNTCYVTILKCFSPFTPSCKHTRINNSFEVLNNNYWLYTGHRPFTAYAIPHTTKRQSLRLHHKYYATQHYILLKFAFCVVF